VHGSRDDARARRANNARRATGGSPMNDSAATAAPTVEYASRPVGRNGFAVALTQTGALFIDAYRELNSKRLFWITLILSLLVVVAFAFVGINDRGVTIFGKLFPGVWNTNFIPADTFYKFLFIQFAVPYWLGVGASILALISVGSVFPDFLNAGSIDLYLAKPIGRLR